MKKKLFKPFAWLTCIAILAASCSSEDFTTPQVQNTLKAEIPFNSIKMDENGQLKMKFAESLAKALFANKDLRRLVKEEALKKFDKDYDVIYQLVKNKRITPTDYTGKNNGKIDKSILSKSSQATTFRQALLPFFKNEAELIEIEQKLPLLTIFVPELPLGYFSAETWDINDENQVPDVAIRLNTTNDVPVIGKDGNKYVIEAELTPGFPIVVIKDNERVILKKTSSKQNSKSALIDAQFEYLDDNFDPEANWVPTPIINNSEIDQVLIDSYNVWEGYAPEGWQRDYIYYGLIPSKTKGQLTFNYKEHLTSFRLTGDPKIIFDIISRNSSPGDLDPSLVTDYRMGSSSGWTDGNFEFLVNIYIGSQSSTEGLFTKRGIDLKPSDLFELKYTTYSRFNWPFKKTYIRTEIVSTKKINLLDPKYDNKGEILTWDLSNYSNRWRFVFEEVDLTVTNNRTEKLSSKYNVNFEVNAAAGSIFEKVGLKFGASAEQSKENTYNFNYTTGSNDLYETTVPFFENVVNKDPFTGQYNTQTYSTGRVEFEVRPIRVQW
jgi:hypothetical protein